MRNDILDHNPDLEQTPKYVYRPFWGLFRLALVAYAIFKQIWLLRSVLNIDRGTDMKLWVIVGLFSIGNLLFIVYQSWQGYNELKGLPNRYSPLRRIFVIYTILLFISQLYNSYQVVSNHPTAVWGMIRSLLMGYGLTLIVLIKDLKIIKDVAKGNP